MAALLQVGVRRKGFREALNLFDKTEQQLRAPLAGVAGEQTETVVRRGVADQFDAEGIPRWVETHPFGDFFPSPQILGGSGSRVAMAWANAPAEKGPREIRLRLNDAIALTHHRGAIIRPRGAPAIMRVGLGHAVNVWPSDERLQQGYVIPARPIRFTSQMLLGVKAVQVGFFAR